MYKENSLIKICAASQTFSIRSQKLLFFPIPNAHTEGTNEAKRFSRSSAKLTYQM